MEWIMIPTSIHTAVTSDQLIPKKIAVETIFGCNLHCTMCDIDEPTHRKKGMMPFELFTKRVIDPLMPLRDHFELLDLFCLGEPMLDPLLFERIKYAKRQGFRNIGISTNADIMTPPRQELLLESGIDTVIISIDGATKETHEAIRRGSNFERTVGNALSFIAKRNEGNYPTRLVTRFIHQHANRHEWEPFRQFWETAIARERGDRIGRYDVHSQGPLVTKADALHQIGMDIDEAIERKACPIISDIIYILADGTVTLCSQDWLHAAYNFGNVKDASPIEIFNTPKFRAIRMLHAAGNKNQMDLCRGCTIAYSSRNAQYF